MDCQPKAVAARQSLRHAFILYLPRLVGMTLGSVTLTMVLRKPGPAPYGAYSVALAYWSLWGLAGCGAVSMASQFLLSRSYYDGSRPRTASLLRTAAVCSAILAVATGALGALMYRKISAVFFHDVGIEGYMAAGLALHIGLALSGFFQYALRGLHMFKTISSMDLIESLGRNVVWLVFASAAMCAGDLLWGHVLATGISVLVAMYLSRTMLFDGAPVGVELGREVLQASGPFIQIIILNYVFSSFSILALGHYRGADEVGIYSGLLRLVGMVNGPLIAAGLAFAPTLPGVRQRGEIELDKLFERSFKMVVLFLPIVALVSYNGASIYRFLLGEAHDLHLPVIHVLCVFMAFNALASFFGLYIDSLGYAGERASWMAVIAILHMIGCGFAAGRWGVLGVAVVSTALYMILVLGYMRTIVNHHSADFIRRSMPLLGRVLLTSMTAYWICRAMIPASVSAFARGPFWGLFLSSMVYASAASLIYLASGIRRRNSGWVLELT